MPVPSPVYFQKFVLAVFIYFSISLTELERDAMEESYSATWY